MPRKQKSDGRSGDEQPRFEEHFEYANALPVETGSMARVMDDEVIDHHTKHTIPSSLEYGEKYHAAGKRDVELYIRTYNTLLRSSGEVSLKALVQAHYNIDSSLHPDARSYNPDMSALIYSVLRLPTSILHCSLVLLGQSEEVFQQQGIPVDTWQAVTASARRRSPATSSTT